MIDIENQVFTTISNVLIAAYGNDFNVSGVYQNAPAQFPCVSIIQEDSYTDTSTIDSHSRENSVLVMFEINVYSNDKFKKKSECKQIMALINDRMIGLGFTRTMLKPVPNVDDSIYRMLARYTGRIDTQETVYRR